MKVSNINLNSRNHFGETPLFKSLQVTSDTFAIKLIEAGADISVPNLQNETPLHQAVKKHPDIARLLIEKGADINALDFDLYGPLHEAVLHSGFEMVAMLLYYGADANCLSLHGLTPFMLSVNYNVDINIQRLLLEYEADLNRVADDGYSTLLLALNSKSPLVADIIERGGNVNYSVPESNALELSLHLQNNAVFKMIWPLFDYRTVYTTMLTPLLPTFQWTNLPTNAWFECFTILFHSDIAYDVIHHYLRYDPENFFSAIIDMFHQRKMPESDLYPFICIGLSLGAKVFLNNVELIYTLYGYNETLKLFLQTNVIINKSRYPTLPLFIADVQVDPLAVINNYRLYRNISFVPDQVRNISNLIDYFTPPLRFRQQIQNCCEFGTSISEFFELRDSVTDEYADICDRMSKFSVPSLVELSRNTARKAICIKMNIRSTSRFYTVLYHSRIPSIIKKLIAYEAPVNARA